MTRSSSAALGSLREIATGRVLSGAELESEISTRGGLWSALGVGPGSRVALLEPPGIVFAADLLALWRLGACAVPLDPALPLPELETVLADCRATLALVRGRSFPGGAVAGVSVRESPETADGPASAPAPADPSGEVLLLYTSGTVAGPKGAVHSRAGLLSRLEALRRAVPASARARALCVLPLHHGHGLIGGLLLPLLSGADVALAGPLGAAAGYDLGGLIAQTRATFVTGVPALWRAALRASAPPPSGLLKRVHCASSALDPRLKEELVEWTGRADVVDAYGMTETASWVSGSEPGETRPGVVGRGWGAEFAVSPEGSPEPAALAPGRDGEVWVRADSLMRGYQARPDLSARVLRGGWYRTGDRGVLEADGALRLLGRLDDAINRAGVKVQPEEVEAALGRHPEVAEACVFGIPHALAGEIVAAALVWRAGGARSFAEIERWCAQRLAEAKVPRRWFALESLPRTSLGKLRRRETAAACAEGGIKPA